MFETVTTHKGQRIFLAKWKSKSFILVLIVTLMMFYVPVQMQKFSFVQVTDIHIGDSKGEYVLDNLRLFVKQINQMKHDKNISYVFASGDLTDSGLPVQFDTFKNIMEDLQVPWIPMIGNHDIWMYNSSWEEPFPTADLYFGNLFKDKFTQDLKAKFEYTNYTVRNQEHENITSWFHNFELDLGNMIIYGLDFNSRKHALGALGYKGSWPGAELHDFPKGSLQWFQDRLSRIQSRPKDARPVSIVLIHHHPYRTPIVIPGSIFSFSSHQKDTVRHTLEQFLPIDIYWGVFAGHFHRWFDGTAFDEWKTFHQHETAACKDEGAYSIIHVEDGKIIDIENLTARKTNNS